MLQNVERLKGSEDFFKVPYSVFISGTPMKTQQCLLWTSLEIQYAVSENKVKAKVP